MLMSVVKNVNIEFYFCKIISSKYRIAVLVKTWLSSNYILWEFSVKCRKFRTGVNESLTEPVSERKNSAKRCMGELFGGKHGH